MKPSFEQFVAWARTLVHIIRYVIGGAIGAIMGGVAGANVEALEVLPVMVLGGVVGLALGRFVRLPRGLQFLERLDDLQAKGAAFEEEIGLQSEDPRHFSVSIEIARPPEAVFTYLANVEKIPEWQDEVQSVQIEREEIGGQDMRFRRKDRALGGDSESTVAIRTSSPSGGPTIGRVVFDYEETPLPVESKTYELASAESGCLVTVHIHFADVRMVSQVRLAFVPKVRYDLMKLKQILEEGAT